MNIGLVSQALPYLPSRGGFRLYGGNLIRCLSRRHRIDLVSLLQDDDEKHLSWPGQYCASVSTVPAGEGKWLRPINTAFGYCFGKPLRYRAALARLLRRRAGEWDVVHVEGAYAGGLIPASLPIPKVLSLHDSWTLRCREMLKCSHGFREKTYQRLRERYERRYEKLVYPRFDRCIVVAQPDLDEVRSVVPRATVELIPYGTDTEYFHPVPVERQEATMVFHSHLGYPPNIEAALEFANEVFPIIRRSLPSAVFHLVGAQPGPQIRDLASRPGIRISANLPDLRPAVCSSRVYVSAIRYGTGLKSKILEAMAMRMPIVCYPGSAVGIECVHRRHLLVAGDPAEFAAHVLNLLRNPEQADRLAQAGRDLVVEKYSWDSRARIFEELYENLIGKRRAAAAVSQGPQEPFRTT